MLRGKRVVVVDDSIVRGSTTRKLVQMLCEAGAAEVHLRVSSPPIISPCFYGIDMADQNELIAAGRTVEQVRERLGATSLAYLSLDGLQASTEQPSRALLPRLPDRRVPDRDPRRHARRQAAVRGAGSGRGRGRSMSGRGAAHLRRRRASASRPPTRWCERISAAVASTAHDGRARRASAASPACTRPAPATRRSPPAATASAPRCCCGAAAGRLHGLGIDLVAMSVNDVITTGAAAGVLPRRDHLRADRAGPRSPSWSRASPTAAARPAARCSAARRRSTPT